MGKRFFNDCCICHERLKVGDTVVNTTLGVAHSKCWERAAAQKEGEDG